MSRDVISDEAWAVPRAVRGWNTIHKNFDRRSKAGVWARVLEQVQAMAHHDVALRLAEVVSLGAMQAVAPASDGRSPGPR